MTISCRCPKCNRLCGFREHSAGRRARCRGCGQVFIIPAEDGAKPAKVREIYEDDKPLEGFYRAAFLENWKVLFKRESITPLVFIAALVGARFLLLRSCCADIEPSGEFDIASAADRIVFLLYFACLFTVSYGWLMGYYLNVIYEAAFGADFLPDVYLGTIFSFWWYIIKPCIVFAAAAVIVELPYITARVLLGWAGVNIESLWTAEPGWVTLLQVLFVAGVFLFPMAILTLAVGEDAGLLRPDCLIRPILKAPRAYLAVVALVLAACVAEYVTPTLRPSENATKLSAAARLGANYAVHIFALLAMRAVGLFFRHYGCYMSW